MNSPAKPLQRLVLSDTWWWGMSGRVDDVGFARLVARRAAQGFTAAFVVVGPGPDAALDDPRQANSGGRAWGADGADSGYLDVAERRLDVMVDAGLTPIVVGSWGFHLERTGVAVMTAHWMRLLDRFGDLPAIWCAAGEALMPPPAELGGHDIADRIDRLRDGWSTVLAAIRAADGGRHPVTVHPSLAVGHRASTDMVDPGLLDLNLLQTGHEGLPAALASLAALAAVRASHPGLPAMVAEVDYEGIMAANGAELQRLLVWMHLLGGAAGHGYGAQGLWGFDRGRDDDVGARWGRADWQRAARLDGARQQGLAISMLAGLGALEPVDVAVAADPPGRLFAAAKSEAGVLVVYLPQAALQSDGVPIGELRLKGMTADAAATWFDPRRGIVLGPAALTVTGDGAVLRGDSLGITPTTEDWVLVVESAR